MKPLLAIKDLNVQIDHKTIISDLNLTINPGETHVIMGPNGSGKSTLAYTLAKNPNYTITSGSINFLDKDLLQLSATQCAQHGLFVSFQYPIALPGVATMQFLKSSVNAIRISKNLPPMDTMDFLNAVKSNMQLLGIPNSMLQRSLNEGCSGGEKKRNEILQLLLLQPKLAILDEIDSGLDIDTLKTVAEGINSYKNSNNALLIITHYQRLLEYITPDVVHILANGNLVHSGDKNLPLELEQKGYVWLTQEGS